MNSLRMLEQDDENDDAAEVTWEDQQRINSFSKLNTRMRNIQEKLQDLKAFLHMPQPRALKRLERDQADIDSQISSLSSTVEQCETEMKGLKVTLYAKFGRAINLDE
ncbi:hypothetical protein B0H16DRAFT_1666109 [Mycena metata]|uniref:Prefoldin subunit 4 n=1 Tax=Mycena metata TaxID=1033252 RepID=A0AAD7HLL9_9AGAR|nr:hypothetical protein B0H16DRAFT_1666109 [Mycena metata]